MSSLRFEWDEAKNGANQRKHGMSFQLASQVFDDPLHLTLRDRAEDGEERWVTFGTVEGGSVDRCRTHAARIQRRRRG